MKRVSAPVISSREVMPGVRLILLNAPEIASAAIPGQFVMVGCGGDCLLRRPLSIHRVEGGNVAFLFNVIGKGTEWLAQRQPGDCVDLLGPLGNGFSIDPAARRLFLISGGIGFAPLRFLADRAEEQGRKVEHWRYGTFDGCQLAPIRMQMPPNIDISGAAEVGLEEVELDFPVVEGFATDDMASISDHIANADQVFACGPVPMYITMSRRSRELFQGKPVQVSLEVRMGCGMGLCYGCTVKTRHGLKEVCKDGPVFALDDVVWDWLGC